MKTLNLFLDLETIPAGEMEQVEYPSEPTLMDVKVGNRKPELADFYRREQLPKLLEAHHLKCDDIRLKAEETHRKKALQSLNAEILCLGYAFYDSPVEVLTGKEKSILMSFEDVLSSFKDKRHAITWIGHNIKEFDLKLIYHRAIKYKIENLIYHLQLLAKENIFDTMEKWGYKSYREMTSLDDILNYLGLEGKGEITGANVFDYWKAGKLNEIYKYCKDDVLKTRLLYNIMMP